jgi:glycerol-3-phosphate O-acyltransferase
VTALPQPLADQNQAHRVYILTKPYAADEQALKQCLKGLGVRLTADEQIIALPHPGKAGYQDKANRRFSDKVQRLLAQNPNTLFIPVSVFWGRSPRKVKSVFQAYLANSWAVPGKLKRALIVLFQVRQVACYFGQECDLRAIAAQCKQGELQQTLSPLLSQQFIKHKETVIGPDLSHQRMLSQHILQSDAVKQCIEQQASEQGLEQAKLYRKAEKYLKEMASDYSYPVVRVFDIFLSWLWEKLYQGVEVKGIENVLSVAEDHELVYVPCHRSHIDYLLLSYVIYHKGLMPPHIAAGINLNLPIVGGLLRRGGAFFIRRQFRDNKLYRAVLESYVATMCQKGFSIEYFIEGGRSRTGFLLPPKPGMLAMTLRAAQDQSDKPLAFLPVYIGYERLLESHSYINELYGEKKQKESLLSLLSARHYLKEDYGKVHMSVGKPILAETIWQNLGHSESPKPNEGEAFFDCVDQLGKTILTQINGAAYLSPQNFIATALLSSKRHALVEQQLLTQIQLLQSLTQVPGFNNSLQLDSFDPKEAIEHALSLNIVQKNEDALGDIYYLNQQAQVGATFLRNNTLHVFILPALIASIFINVNQASFKRIHAICQRLYPYLKSEFFLPWQAEDTESVIEHILDVFLASGLIEGDSQGYRSLNSESEAFHALMVLSGAGKGSIERFYITAQLMVSAPDGYYDKQTLEAACTKMAERLSLLHEFHAPDFFDKNLFRTFISSLIKEGIFIEDEQGHLHYERVFTTAKKLARYVLSPGVKRGIKQITQSPLA